MRRWIGVCILLSVTAMLRACSALPAEPPAHLDASGIILDIPDGPISPGAVTRLLVQHPRTPYPRDRSIVHIGAGTPIFERDPQGQLRTGSVADIRINGQASIEIEDVELRSYPRQVFATRLEMH